MSECVRADGARHRRDDGRPVIAHDQYAYRAAYEAEHGPLDPALVLHHTCGNPWCVNVAHLVPMTRAEHLREHGYGGDWGQADKTHCPQGHPYDDANTYVYVTHEGYTERHCRACRLEAKRRYNARKRGAG